MFDYFPFLHMKCLIIFHNFAVESEGSVAIPLVVNEGVGEE